MPGPCRLRLLAALSLAAAVATGCSSGALNAPRPTTSASFVSPLSDRRVELRIEDGQLTGAGAAPEVRTWIDQAAQAIGAYYGHFPVGHARLLVERVDGSGVRWARTFAHSGAFIRVGVGGQTTTAEFASDWILTHEFVHLALPQLADEHDWLQEGAATYVEPIARAQAGQLSPERVWAEFALNMPRGLPAEGDRGLDFTPTWARTYWGGALFCLVADVKIRSRTGNRAGLQQALRAILEGGGTLEHRWSIREALKAGDRATGVDVLSQMYEEWRAAPVQVDLPRLWRELGVEQQGRRAALRDDAPLADIRRAITAPAPAAHLQAYAGD
jgi:hypothetical protein